jgi:hypothetical protein
VGVYVEDCERKEDRMNDVDEPKWSYGAAHQLSKPVIPRTVMPSRVCA